MGQTVGNMVAEANAKAQKRFLSQVVSTAFFFHAVIAVPLLLVSVLLALGYFIRFLPLHTGGARIALVVTCMFAALSFPLKVSSMTLRSLNRVDVEQTTQTISNLLRALALIAILLLGLQLVSVAVVHGLALVASGVAAYMLVNQTCAEARPRISLFSSVLLQRMLVPSLAFFVLTLASTLAFSIDSLVIAYNLGSGAVTQYAVPFQVIMLVTGFFAVALGALTPAVTDHHARGAGDVLSSAYTVVMRGAILYGVSATIFLSLAGQPLLRLWAGLGVFPGYATFELQLALLFMQVLLYPAHTVLMATSSHYGYAVSAITEGVLNLILSLWWVHIWGLPGVIAGTVAARILTTGWYLPLAAMRVLGVSPRDLVKSLRKATLLSLSGLALVRLVSLRWPLVSGAGSFAISCAATLAFIAAFVTFEVSAEERLLLVRALTRRCHEWTAKS
jgi:O-antigen/teichoic acid export membrane protein